MWILDFYGRTSIIEEAHHQKTVVVQHTGRSAFRRQRSVALKNITEIKCLKIRKLILESYMGMDATLILLKFFLKNLMAPRMVETFFTQVLFEEFNGTTYG